MKSWRYISVLILFLGVCSPSLFSSITEVPAKTPAATYAQGKIQALIVVGDVSLIDSTGIKTSLQKGQVFTEGATIVAGPSSGTTLVFSNGATIRVKENNQVKVVKFVQAPFDENNEGTFLRLNRDPSHSETVLEVQNGALKGEVKPLNKAAGSTFQIVTKDRGAMDAEEYFKSLEPPIAISLTANASGQITGATVTGTGANSPQAQAALTDLFKAINSMRAAQNLAPINPVPASTNPLPSTPAP